jgi:hypothetical protein
MSQTHTHTRIYRNKETRHIPHTLGVLAFRNKDNSLKHTHTHTHIHKKIEREILM